MLNAARSQAASRKQNHMIRSEPHNTQQELTGIPLIQEARQMYTAWLPQQIRTAH